MTAVATTVPPGTSYRPTASDDAESGKAFEAIDDVPYEFVYGRLVEKPTGYDSHWTAGRLGGYLTMYILNGHGGDLLPEQSFRCFPTDPQGYRRPDLAYIVPARVPAIRPQGQIPFRPDLAVEVVSPTDNVDELELKLADYEAAGIPLVWVVIPAVRRVRSHAIDGTTLRLQDGDTLRGDPVLPGFAVAVADLFPPRVAG